MTIDRRIELASVADAVERLLPGGYPTIVRTARRLRLSPRTLQRRLNDTGVSYREMVQKCRLEKARHLLAHSTLGIGEIAAALGYADPSSFSRFFLRLAGTPPRAYRARSRSRQK
jgi:AraC-like DNA-binding protein